MEICGDFKDNDCDGLIDEKADNSGPCTICEHYQLSVPATECLALVDLYNSTNGASWTNKTNWLSMSAPNVGTWHGIDIA